VLDFRLPVGEVGVGGADSSVVLDTCCWMAAVEVTEAGTQKAGSLSSLFKDVGLRLPAFPLPNFPRGTSFMLSTL